MLHIEGRRWFQRTYGNTYHSVRIYEVEENHPSNSYLLDYLPFNYGYDDQYLQTALDWLKANGYAPADAPYGTLYLREVLHATHSVVDVKRKRDL